VLRFLIAVKLGHHGFATAEKIIYEIIVIPAYAGMTNI
jgi:hypothetical protein